MTLTLAISPCPNDTFAFDAMLNGKIDTEGLIFDYVLSDIENLNKKTINNKTDIIKLSFPAFFSVTDKYILLNSGSAIGFGCGPLLISKNEFKINEIEKFKIAIPGKNTTANFLLNFAIPNAKNKTEMVFSEIENAILNEKADAGVIIHENRFTYQKKGLKKIIDLGEYWENMTGKPIPLAGIAVKRNLPDEIKQKINRVLKKSIEFAFANPLSGYKFVKENAQQTEDEVIKKHIDLYVNKFTVDMGNEGRKTIEFFYDKMIELGFTDNDGFELFI